jgi:hypothetical protein
MLRKLILCAALALAPLASACGLLTNPAPIGAATVVDDRAMFAVEAAYNVPAHAYVTADANGLLTPALKAQIKPLMLQAYDALELARAAYRAGNVAGFEAQAAAVRDLASLANALIPK